MKAKHAKRAARLTQALADLPRIRKSLKKQDTNYDSVDLELSAADISDGLGQGSDAWTYIPADLTDKILRKTEKVIRAELKRLGVKVD